MNRWSIFLEYRKNLSHNMKEINMKKLDCYLDFQICYRFNLFIAQSVSKGEILKFNLKNCLVLSFIIILQLYIQNLLRESLTFFASY